MSNYCYTCMNEIESGNFCPHCQHENFADNVVYRLLPGTILNNKYLVGNCIGEGGFGITYIGRDLTLQRRVAIKEYYPSGYVNRNNTVNQLVTASTDPKNEFFAKGLRNFLEEARRTAALTNVPGIVDVRDFFEENGTGYIIMEYLNGVNLSTYLKENGVFTPVQIFTLMLPVTNSLQKIHETGLIHRDISPQNIMYMQDGTLKLMDFGSARFFTNAQKEMSVTLKQGYAPEEQYSKNGDQGPWTDVYGLCATMYKCITGKTPAEAIDRIRNDTLIPPRNLGVNISDPMQNTLLYGLAVYKNDRCQSMRELAELMQRSLDQQNVGLNNPAYYNQIQQQRAAGAPGYQNGYPNPPYPVDDSTMLATETPMQYQQNYYPPAGYPPQEYQQPQGYQQPQEYQQPQKASSGKSLIIIAVSLLLCIIIIAGTIVYLVLQGGEEAPTPITPSGTQSLSTDANTDDPSQSAVNEETEKPEATQKPTEAPTQPPTQAPTQPPATAAPSGKITARASGNLAEQEGHTYGPENVLKNDGKCWCPKEGAGTNGWIILDLPQKQTIGGLDIVNGYAGTEAQYKNNGKVKSIKIEFSDGSSVTKTLSVNSVSNRSNSQHVSFSPVETTYVKITIVSYVKGEKWEDTCITYISPTN